MIFAFLAMPAFSQSLDSGRACLARGDIERARDFFAAAHAERPDDQAVTLLYAQSLGDPQEAKELYVELVDAPSAPDSIKAAAHARLGGLAYASGDYGAAVEHYGAACGMAFLPECGSVLPRARRLYQEAIDMNQALEARAASVKTRAGPPRYAVQAGSYGSQENAERQKRSIESLGIDNARIERANVDGKTLYRIRIGSFASKDEAQAFARRKLRSKNIAFSIVKE